MGGWTFIRDEIEWCCQKIGAKHPRPHYVGRKPSAATATGLLSKHNAELREFLDAAFQKDAVNDNITDAY